MNELDDEELKIRDRTRRRRERAAGLTRSGSQTRAHLPLGSAPSRRCRAAPLGDFLEEQLTDCRHNVQALYDINDSLRHQLGAARGGAHLGCRRGSATAAAAGRAAAAAARPAAARAGVEDAWGTRCSAAPCRELSGLSGSDQYDDEEHQSPQRLEKQQQRRCPCRSRRREPAADCACMCASACTRAGSGHVAAAADSDLEDGAAASTHARAGALLTSATARLKDQQLGAVVSQLMRDKHRQVAGLFLAGFGAALRHGSMRDDMQGWPATGRRMPGRWSVCKSSSACMHARSAAMPACGA
jgi:hypothetical protein